VHPFISMSALIRGSACWGAWSRKFLPFDSHASQCFWYTWIRTRQEIMWKILFSSFFEWSSSMFLSWNLGHNFFTLHVFKNLLELLWSSLSFFHNSMWCLDLLNYMIFSLKWLKPPMELPVLEKIKVLRLK